MKLSRLALSTLFLIIIVGSIPLFAGFSITNRYGVSMDVLWYGSIPSEFHHDPLPIRSHLSIGGTFTPAVFPIGDTVELSAGLSGYYTTRSIVFGTTFWRPFMAFGTSIDMSLYISPSFVGKIGTALLLGMYLPTWELAPIWRLQLAGEYALTEQSQRNRWFVRIPISVDIRSDYISVFAGIGFSCRINRLIAKEQNR